MRSKLSFSSMRKGSGLSNKLAVLIFEILLYYDILLTEILIWNLE